MKILVFFISVSLSGLLSAQSSNENITILDNAQRPQMSSWKVEGADANKFSVEYVNGGKEIRKNIIKLKGNGLNTSFVFKGAKGNELDLPGYKILQWKMKYDEPFMFQVNVTTSEGKKYLLYSDLNERVNNDDVYFHIGLGSKYTNGKWHTVTRNIEADIVSMLPGVKLISIDVISFRGSGYLDDIKAFRHMPIDVVLYSGANNGLKGWHKIGKGGSFSLDYDPVVGKVMRFDSGGKKALFGFKKLNRAPWYLGTNSALQWKMKMNASYKICIWGLSSSGKYSMCYDNSKSTEANHYGLGTDTTDDQWRSVTRNLSSDVRMTHSSTEAITIDSIVLFGRGIIGDIKLLVDTPTDTDVTKEWEIYDDDPKGATIRVVSDLEKGDVVELKGSSLKNGYKFSGDKGIPDSVGNPVVVWDMNFSEIFDIMLMLETDDVVSYIHYVPLPEDHIKQKDGALYIGIGETKTDGRWHTMVRDLSEDIKLLIKNGGYRSCKAFMIRGSGKIGKIDFYKDKSSLRTELGASSVASMVIGQFSFGHNLKNLWDVQKPKMNSVNHPNSVAVDNEGGVYVCDTDNNRLLYWTKRPSIPGDLADLAYTKNDLKQPSGVFVYDKNLFVSDTGNNRVLFFKLPLQENSEPYLIMENGLREPRGVFYDGKNFFIADTGNNRVLVWNSLPKRAKKPFDVVLGQSFENSIEPNKGSDTPSYGSMLSPYSVFSDGTSLYVADTGNNRILIFKEIPTMNGWHSDIVIGQDGFKKNLVNKGRDPSASSLDHPEGVCLSDGKLFVSDSLNNRILIYTKLDADNIIADGVIGQVDFSSSAANYPSGLPRPGSLFYPSGIYTDNDILYVTDKNNNRVLVY